MAMNRYLVEPGRKVSLAEYDPDDTEGMRKAAVEEELATLAGKLNKLQELLYATGKYALLVVLQGVDTSGKDGVIEHVIGVLNPQGCQVTAFKVPTAEELAHDFLWRIHKAVPQRGMVGIFNRSHYEDVLVVRVENLAPEAVWRERYEAINAFEESLVESGVVICKFFLYISKEEQRERLQDRLDKDHEHWKFRLSDMQARAKWDDYLRAYEDALANCSTPHAPWYVVPADKKWYRNLVISRVLADKLEALGLKWPALEPEAVGVRVE